MILGGSCHTRAVKLTDFQNENEKTEWSLVTIVPACSSQLKNNYNVAIDCVNIFDLVSG